MRKRRVHSLKDRLESHRIITESGHWLSTYSDTKDGYSQIFVNGKNERVHRVSYSVYYNIPLDQVGLVLHKPSCNRRDCFNPDHLYIGTHLDNMLDRREAGTDFNINKTHCIAGHKFDESNTYIRIRNGRKHRQCKICSREASDKLKEKRKAYIAKLISEGRI